MGHLEKMTKKRLGELLIAEGLISSQQLQEALQIQRYEKKMLGEIFVDKGYVTEYDIAKTLTVQFQVPYLSPKNYTIDEETLELLPREMFYQYIFIPVDRFHNILTIVMAGLLPREVIEDIQTRTGCELAIYIGTATEVRERLYELIPPTEQSTFDIMAQGSHAAESAPEMPPAVEQAPPQPQQPQAVPPQQHPPQQGQQQVAQGGTGYWNRDQLMQPPPQQPVAPGMQPGQQQPAQAGTGYWNRDQLTQPPPGQHQPAQGGTGYWNRDQLMQPPPMQQQPPGQQQPPMQQPVAPQQPVQQQYPQQQQPVQQQQFAQQQQPPMQSQPPMQQPFAPQQVQLPVQMPPPTSPPVYKNVMDSDEIPVQTFEIPNMNLEDDSEWGKLFDEAEEQIKKDKKNRGGGSLPLP